MQQAVKQNIDRRALIKGAFIATAAGLVSAAALRATITPGAALAASIAADPLVALGAAERKADRRCHRAWARQDEAEGRARKAGFNIDVPIMAVGTYGCVSVEEVVTAAQDAGFSPDRMQELTEVYRQRVADARRQRIAAGLRPFDKEAKAANAEWDRIMRAIVNTQATSYAGLAVKLRIIKPDMEDDGDTKHSVPLIRSALRDALRLAKAGAA